MNTYPVTVQKLRERICANPECGITFCPKNNKAIYHCLECKNRATQLRLQKEFGEQYKWFKDFIYNIKVLGMFFNDGKNVVTDEMLDTVKFRRPVGTLPEYLKKKGLILFYGKYMLCRINDTSYEIIKT